MILLNNDNETDDYFNKIFQQALDSTMEDLLDILHKYIESEVYSYNQVWYERSMDLLNNWDYTKSQLYGTLLESNLYMNEAISYDPNLWQHGGSPIVNDEFIEIVNDGKIGNICNFPQIGARPFWDKFIKEADKKFYSIFMKNCRALGVDIR